MSWVKAELDVRTQKVTYVPMTEEEIAESQARIAEIEAKELEQNETNTEA